MTGGEARPVRGHVSEHRVGLGRPGSAPVHDLLEHQLLDHQLQRVHEQRGDGEAPLAQPGRDRRDHERHEGDARVLDADHR